MADTTARHWSRGLAVPATIFILCLALPVIFQLGTLRLSPYRVVLLVMFLPCVWSFLTGTMGRIRFADLLVLAIASWSALSFLRVHGVIEGLEPAGIGFIETLTPYLLARFYIRNAADFRAMVRLLLVILLGLAPFVAIETLTGWNGPIGIADAALQTYPDVAKPPRWGLDRVQGPFEHPILFGVFAGSVLALCFYTLTRARAVASTGVALIAALSLSSGPMVALLAQTCMIAWDRMLKRLSSRWALLAALVMIAYCTIDLVSNRTPAEVLITYAAFNADTAYNRLLIWDWGWVNIWQNPWFGLGHSDWQREWFMTASFDMFWLQRAMVHGLPVGVLYQILIVSTLLGLMRGGARDAQNIRMRTGLAICLTGFYIAGMTVHLWNATFVWLMFLLGSAGWMTGDLRNTATNVLQPRPSGRVTRTPAGALAHAARKAQVCF